MDITIPCPCPGTPHQDGDVVTLRDKPTLHMGTTAFGWANAQATNKKPSSGDIAELYLSEGITGWTFTLEDGSPRPLDDENIGWLLDDFALAYPIADAASELYTEVIFRPLVGLLPKPSRSSRTATSTSRSRPSSRKTPSPS